MASNITTEGNDEFKGTPANETFRGEGGNDTFNGGGGSDTLLGGAGDDSFTILYEPKTVFNVVDGGAGENSLFVDLSTSKDGLTSIPSFLVNANNNAELYLPIGALGFSLRYSNIQKLNLTATEKDDQLIGGNGRSFLKGLAGNDTYFFSFSNSVAQGAGNKIRDTSGNDTLLLQLPISGRRTPVEIKLASPTPGTIGLQRDESALILDINQDGIINRDQDFTILNFFDRSNAGAGFIETINNLSGDAILNANRNFISVGSDFDSDGKAELIWRNTQTNQNVIWRFDGITLVDSRLLPSPDSLNWKIAGTGDFDTDGETDLVWRNPTTGDNRIWLMNGTAYADVLPLLPISDPNWEIGATGDFNGDGKPDLAWRNYATGENAIWLMDGNNIAKSEFILPVGDRNWIMSSAGDFNGDSKADLLWRNPLTGENAIWFINDTNLQGTTFITPAVGASWRIGQTADFNRDGKTDIAWRETSGGTNAIWLMNGTQLEQGLLAAPLPGSQWNLIGSRAPLT